MKELEISSNSLTFGQRGNRLTFLGLYNFPFRYAGIPAGNLLGNIMLRCVTFVYVAFVCYEAVILYLSRTPDGLIKI